MDLYEGLLTRRSVRVYDESRRANAEDIGKILRAAMYAPSAHAKAPWEFAVIQDAETLEKIAQIHQYAKFVPQAGTAVVVCGDTQRQHRNGDAEYWMVDCAAATQNILLAAHSLGLATCWCGIYPVKERIADFKKLLELPENLSPFSVVALGYAAREPRQPEDRFDESKIRRL